MPEKNTCDCGAPLLPGANFCKECGKALSEKTVCPHCSSEVDPGNFCYRCGQNMRTARAGPDIRENLWARGEEDFAVAVTTRMIEAAADGSFIVRHGSKALFFEEGRLVEIAESGRYSTQENGLLNRLLKRKRNLSAVVVDAGDVELDFAFIDLKTRDGLFADVGMDVVVRLEEENSFFVNVMKERRALKIVELRRMLFGEIQNALQEAVGSYDFADLNSGIAAKNEIASRMEAHLRQTFSRSGLGFGQVRNLRILHKDLDEAERIRGDAKAQIEHAKAEASRKDAQMYGKKTVGEKEIEEGQLDADLIRRRLEVFNRLKTVEVDKIKSEEDFRKFRAEIDKDQALDESEWKEFKDEILWKEQDRKRDRRFLERKIELQQDCDTRKLEIVTRGDLSVEEKRQGIRLLDLELEGEISRDFRRIEGLAKVDELKTQALLARKRTEELGRKEIEVQAQLKEIELEKQKGLALHELAKLDIEEKRLKSELGLSNLEKMKAIRRQDERERALDALEIQQKVLEGQLKAEAERHRQEIERIGTIAKLGIEQLVAVSGSDQARILGDLAQSQTLKGMSADQIAAMKDPVAFAKALEERARSNPEMYERMFQVIQSSAQQIAAAHKESADRAERMFGVGMQSVSGQSQKLVESERSSADRAERVADKAMEQMGSVAASQRSFGSSGGDGMATEVQVCGKCRQRVPADRNFCPNCGEKLY